MSNMAYIIKYNTLYKLTLCSYLKYNFKTWKIIFFAGFTYHEEKKNLVPDLGYIPMLCWLGVPSQASKAVRGITMAFGWLPTRM